MFTNALLKFYFKIISYHSFKKKKKKSLVVKVRMGNRTLYIVFIPQW